MTQLNGQDAILLARRLESRDLRAEEVVRDCLDRIAEREAVVRAWVHLDPDRAIEQARRLDRGPYRGPLHGIPLGVKDIIDTAGQPTAYGSPIYREHVPAIDAACVAIVRAAGGIVLGKTVTAEFAHRLPGPTTNPLDPARTPGGSSSGSAAAVADDMVPLALGTQTTASTIRPASFCGVYGYRPTFGTISCAGVKPSSTSFDTIGLFARSIEDCAFLQAVLLEVPPRPVADLSAPPRIGFCRTPFWSDMEPAAARLVEEAVGRLARTAVVRDVVLPPVLDRLAEAHRIVASYELARNLATERLLHPDGLSPLLRDGKMAEGLRTDAAAYAQALAVLDLCRTAEAALFEPFDVLVAPSTGGIAPEGLRSTGSAAFCALWTALHVPAVSIPLPDRLEGMPLGLQVVAARGRDAGLFEAARWIRRHLG